jgi:hypothetical protein
MHYIFPQNFVYWQKIYNHQEIKEKYLKLILDDYENNRDEYKEKSDWNCNVVTSYFDFNGNNKKIFDQFFIENVIQNPIENCIEELKLVQPSTVSIFKLWYNVYGQNDYQEVHHHLGDRPISYSGIYILDLCGKNNTHFYQPGTTVESHFGSTFRGSDLEEGDVIIFPASLSHYASPAESNKVSVSFNVKCSYEVNS